MNKRYNICKYEEEKVMQFGDSAETDRLILSSRAGNNDAFERLVLMYRPMIDSVIRRFSLGIDETFSEACMGFYRAVNSYSLEQDSVTFGLYAKICIERCIIDMLRREGRCVSGLVDEEVDVDKIAVSDGIQAMLEHREQTAHFLSVAREVLSDFEFDVYRLWMLGYKTADISVKLSSTAKSVDNAKNRMLNKLKLHLSDGNK